MADKNCQNRLGIRNVIKYKQVNYFKLSNTQTKINK